MAKLSNFFSLLVSVASTVVVVVRGQRQGGDDICTSETNTFTVKVDIYASERGYYTFEECGDTVNPTLGIEYDKVYTFIQKDRTNYFHPLRFSYFPDGHHVGANLLSPDTEGTLSNQNSAKSCAANMTCPAPMYFLNDAYLGSYSNNENVVDVTTMEQDYGFDLYMDLFYRPMAAWSGFGTFRIQLKFDDLSYNETDIFYYCHAHQFMAGRIKLLNKGEPVLPNKDEPPMYYREEEQGDFDLICGTYGLDPYQLPHPECPSRFVCDVDKRMREFASCIDAMNCLMMIGMTTKVSSGTELALFIHQMIPHHQNAVNMAKALLKAGFLPCDDLTDEVDPYCIMQGLLYGIVARQNHEIGVMRNILAAMNLPPTDDCEVPVGDLDENNSRRLKEAAGATAAGALFGAAAHLF